MGKCIKSIALSVIAAVFGVLMLSGPVFATPTTDNGTPTSSENADNDDNNDASSDEDQNETTDENNSEDNDDSDDNSEESSVSCYDQVGSLGWIICPGAGLFGSVIDGAYDLLTTIIEVNPIPTDTESPIYVVWKYFKDITNSLFVIFFLVVIFSQLTGVGINNYGIKKILPRIIITAILVNLSYIICTLAVDLSNILGNGFEAFFTNIQNIAIENGSISEDAMNASVSGIVAAMIGVGTVAGATWVAATVYGGIAGVIWVLLPVLISGAVAVISAIVTMAARQALIFLLVMVSPLALISYMLPNTEKWFRKWYQMIFQMLFFYPMFSILYGASQLAGLVIVTSATNWLGVVLGIAVKILPLFMSIPLMRMSGTVLGKIDGIVHRISAPAQGAVARFSMSQQAKAKQQHMLTSGSSSARLARFLEQRRVQREMDTNEYAAHNKDRNVTLSMKHWYDKNGQLSRRGKTHLMLEQEKMDFATTRTNIMTDFDEGFKDDGTDSRVKTKDLEYVRSVNRAFENSIVDSHVAESRKRVVAHNNTKNRAELIHKYVDDETSDIHKRVLEAFNVDSEKLSQITAKKKSYDAAAKKHAAGQALNAAEQAAFNAGPLTDAEKDYYDMGRQDLNFTLADAIAARRKLNKEAQGIYYELYDDSEAGTVPGDALTESLNSGDFNSMTAAISVMAKRGDHADILEILRDNSAKIVGDDNPENIRFQKELNDTCIALKADNPVLWAWAKSNMIRRGKYNSAVAKNKPIQLQPFVDFDTFEKGAHANDDTLDLSYTIDANGARIYNNQKDKELYDMINLKSILTNVRDGKIFAGADRTMYNYFLKAGKDGYLDDDHYLFTDIKHLRASACSGMMDGEQLAAFNNYMTYGYSEHGDNSFFHAHENQVHENLRKYFQGMTAGQLASIKTATLNQFNAALLELNHDRVNTGHGGKDISQELLDILSDKIEQLGQHNMVGARSAMNEDVRRMLGISTTN